MRQVQGQFIFNMKYNDSLCICLRGHNPDLQFAACELKKYIKLAYNMEICIAGAEREKHKGAFVLQICNGIEDTDGNDEFSITVEEGNLLIAGSNKRALLQGVYKFLGQYVGCRWVNPEYEYIPKKAPGLINIRSKNYRPDFTQKGLMLENAGPLEHVVRIVDWMSKNSYNRIFFTFWFWERFKNVLRGEIEKRGFQLTLGVNSISSFLPEGRCFSENPEWFSLHDGERKSAQHCFSSEEGTAAIIGNILQYCKSEATMDAICLWPNDNLLCSEAGSISTYMEFLERMKKSIAGEGLKINIRQMDYNHRLEWDMPDTIPAGNDSDTLLACYSDIYKKVKPIYHQSAAQYSMIHTDYGMAAQEFATAVDL